MFNIFETMKKYLFALVGIMLISAMTFSFSSCSDDEIEPNKKEEPNKPTHKFIGKWKWNFDEEEGSYALLTINNDSTATYTEWDSGWDFYNEPLTYVYNDSENIIYFFDYDNDYDEWYLWDVCKIVNITDTEMITEDFLDEGEATWRRQ